MPMTRSEVASHAARAKNQAVGAKNLSNYLANPKRCQHCNKPILPKEGKPASTVYGKRFCNRSCAASFNNAGKTRNIEGVNGRYKGRTLRSCTQCRTEFPSMNKRRLCPTCREIANLAALPLRRKDSTSRQVIQEHAQKSVQGERSCRICGYSTFVEVCHIKAVASFGSDTLIGEVNHPDNLVYLCPNHHKEFDRGLLDLSGLIAIK